MREQPTIPDRAADAVSDHASPAWRDEGEGSNLGSRIVAAARAAAAIHIAEAVPPGDERSSEEARAFAQESLR